MGKRKGDLPPQFTNICRATPLRPIKNPSKIIGVFGTSYTEEKGREAGLESNIGGHDDKTVFFLIVKLLYKTLVKFLGHSNIINTLIYFKYSNKDLYEAIDKTNGN